MVEAYEYTNFLKHLRNDKLLNDDQYNFMYPSGSRPGILYGLPKVHKQNVPLRPILSAIGTCGYKLSKFLLPFIEPITKNEFTVKDSFSFVEELKGFQNCGNYFMASFDIKSLFTNVPLDETINIVADSLYSADMSVLSLSKIYFKTLLELAVKDVLFLFNGNLYSQVDGIGMGNPLGPTLANAFLCHHEKNWLNDCPPHFQPILYRRYVDDTFLLFRDLSHIQLFFLDYLNTKHPNISFTSEIETNNRLNFLDISVCKVDNKFTTSVYRKETFTGLGLRYDSFVPSFYKTNFIKCLIYRAFRICSTENGFLSEIDFLRSYFCQNKFPLFLLNRVFRESLCFLYNCKPPVITVPKRDVFLKIPFLGIQSFRMKRRLKSVIEHFYPQVNARIIFQSSNSIQNFFKFKDRIPLSLASSVVYQYTCRQCSATYIGETEKQLKVRISQHEGISFRTNRPLSSFDSSKIYEHAFDNNHPISDDSFKILSNSNVFDLNVLESLYILRLQLNLNDYNSSFDLHIVK